MDDLAQFLRDRLDEDEKMAGAAAESPWSVDHGDYTKLIYGADQSAVLCGGCWGGGASVFELPADALHIVRHDPARVLAVVKAKRAAISHADHPDYRDDWRP